MILKGSDSVPAGGNYFATDNVVVTTSVRAAVPTKQTSNPSQYPVQQQGVSFKWSVG